MEKIRICFVETNCKNNGPIKQTLNIVKHIDKSVFEPSLITIWHEETNNSMIDEYRQLGILIRCANLSKKSSVLFGKTKTTSLLQDIKPHIVQGVGMPPYRMSYGYKEAIHLLTLRNYCYDDYPDQYGKIIGPIMANMDMRIIKKRINLGEPFITCSESLSNMYRVRQGVKIPYIRNGVNVAQYTKRDVSQQTAIRNKLALPDKYILTYSGGFIDRKNQRECIEGFLKSESAENAALLLLGDGVDRDDLKISYAKHKNVIFAGKVSNVVEYLHASDVYIATSKSEGLPNGVLEAMACGIPVLLSDIPQHIEVLEADESCGYSYHLGDIEELANKIDQILIQDLKTMGDRAYQAVLDNFTAEGMSKRYQELYLRLHDNKR